MSSKKFIPFRSVVSNLHHHEVQGRAFRVVFEPYSTGLPCLRPPRGEVRGFSSGSRRRLADLLASLDDVDFSFVTLTYPPESVRPSYEIWKRDLEVYCKTLHRAYPGVSIIWRVERQRNGNPHFHLLVSGVGDFRDPSGVAFCKFIRTSLYAWQGAINSDRAIPDHQPLETRIGAYLYLAGHTSKKDQLFPYPVGRYWGIKYRKNLPLADLSTERLTPPELRLLRNYWHSQETTRLRWLLSRGRKGKYRKFQLRGKYFFRIPINFLLTKFRSYSIN